MWEEKDLFRMMKANYNIYGKEIIEINSASEDWTIKYFTNALQYLLDYRAECNSKLFEIKGNGWSGIESINFKKDVKLTAKQCVDIGNFIGCGNIYLDIHNNEPRIDYYNSKKILIYLETGYLLDGEYIFEPKYPNMTPDEIYASKCNEAQEPMLKTLIEANKQLKEKLKKHPIDFSMLKPPKK